MDYETLKLVLASITTLAVSVLLPIVLAIIAQRQEAGVADVKQTLEQTTQVAETVARVQGSQLESIAKVSDATHVLVNSNMAAQLKISMIALRRVADLTANEDDKAAAALAEKLWHEHEGKQAHVDSNSGKGA